MSNLKLPPLDYKSLDGIVTTRLGQMHTKLAFATTAFRSSVNNRIIIEHHDSVIGAIAPNAVEIHNAGWVSSTTTNRVHRILQDNQIPWRFAMSRGENWLTSNDGKQIIHASNLNAYFFEMRAGVWALIEHDGELVAS